MALAYGVLIAGILQYIIQIPFLYKIDLLVAPKISFKFSGVNKVMKLMLPAILGTAVVQINLMVDSIVASLLVSGSISWLYYSDRLVELPLGVFGIAIATVILPALSAKYSKKDISSYKSTLRNALNIAVIFSLPAMFGLIVLSSHIITSLFYYGSFTFNDTLMSSLSLIAYSIGLPAFILMKVLLTAFFSRQDTKTPVRYGIIAVLLNVVMNLCVLTYYLQNPFDGAHAFLALATSLSAWLQVILLYKNLRKSNYINESIFFTRPSYQSLFSCIIMAIILSYTLVDVLEWAQNAYYIRGMLLLMYIIFGATIYASIMYILGYKIKKNYI
jgi:putative peptidoglycan lipid II flippase